MKNEETPIIEVRKEDRSAHVNFKDGRQYYRTPAGIWMVFWKGAGEWMTVGDTDLVADLNGMTADVIGKVKFELLGKSHS